MYKQIVARYIDLIKEFGCAMAIFTEDGKIMYLSDEAFEELGRSLITLEVLPGRYVENEDFWENLRRYRTVFTHKALLKAGTDTYKIRGMMHLICERDEENQIPETYALAFEVREERIFGSVTLERIVEHAGFVAMHWVSDGIKEHGFYAKYISNSISKFGYDRDDFYEGRINWDELIYVEDRAILKEEAEHYISQGKLEYTRQYRVYMKNGQVVPVHDYVHLIVDNDGNIKSVEMVIFDLVMETERNANLLLLESAINRSSNIVIVWDASDNVSDAHIRYVSSNIEHLGFSATGLVSGIKKYRDYIHPDDQKMVGKEYAKYNQKGYQFVSLEYRLVNDAGQEFWVRDESTFVQLPGGNTYLESIVTDITESKRREQQLIEQREDLERRIRYIETDNTMLSDLSLLDFISKEELQELQSSFATLTGSYNAVIDLDGEPITFPDGPETNMGAFYDMFERTEYKKGYFELNKQIRKVLGPVRMEFSQITEEEESEKAQGMPTSGSLKDLVKAASNEVADNTPGVMVGIPLFMDDKHMATWINCAFSEEEIAHIDVYLDSLWTICQNLAKFLYSNTVSQKEAQQAKLSELQARDLLERNSIFSDILRRCNEISDEKALSYVLHKIGDYLKVSRISLFRYTEGLEDSTCWYEWDANGMDRNIDYSMDNSRGENFKQQVWAFEDNGRVVLNGDQMPIRLRRMMWERHIRALVAIPIYTLTMEKQFIVFVESNYDRVWKEDELEFMHTTVSILQGFLQRMRSNISVHDMAENRQEFFDTSREYIYVKNTDTDEILYINPRLEALVGPDMVGKKCYQMLKKQNIKCMDCHQKPGECRELSNCRSYQHLFNRPMNIREMKTRWETVMDATVVMMSPEDM